MIASYIPGEVIAAANGALLAAVVALATLISRLRERIAKVEEWQRLAEQGDDD